MPRLSLPPSTTRIATSARTKAVARTTPYGAQVPRGIALAGLEFGSQVPGVLGQDYFNSAQATYTYFGNTTSGKGFSTVRLPFSWERLQPATNGALNSAYATVIDNEITKAGNAGMKVILDCHNFGRKQIWNQGGFTDTFSTGADTMFAGNLTINNSSGSPASTLLASQYSRIYAGSTINPVSANGQYAIQVDAEVVSDGGQPWNSLWIEFMRIDDNNKYFFTMSSAGSVIQLYKVVNGTQIQIGSDVTFTVTTGTFYTINIDCGQTTAGTITVKINGTTKITGATDGALIQGQVAFYGNGANWGIKNFTLNIAGDTTSGRTGSGLHVVGDGTLTTAHLADLWSRIASRYANNPNVLGYDIMNEPHDMPVPTTSSNYMPSTAAYQLLPNPSFETGTTGWQLDADYTRVNTDAAQGTWSIAQSSAGGFLNLTTTNDANGIDVNINTDYVLSVYTKLAITGNGPVLNINAGSAYGTNLANVALTASSGWIRQSLTFNSGAANKVWVRIYNNNGTVTGNYDGLNLTNGTTPGAYTDTVSSVNTATATLLMQAVINAIRAVDTKKWIICELDSWAGGQSFTANYGSNPTPWWTDPVNRLVYSFHYYQDSDHSGSYNSGTPDNALNTLHSDLDPIITWAHVNNITLHCGEFGTPNQAQWMPVLTALLNLIQGNGIWSTQWAAGDQYTSPTTIQPSGSAGSYTDALQMSIVGQYLGENI